MAQFEIMPGVGLTGISFGERREIHRASLGEYRPFKRTPGAGVTDAYFDSSVMLSYDASDLLSFIEVGGVDVTWRDILLVDRPLEEILRDLERVGVTPEFDGDAVYILPGLGIGLFTPAPDEPEVNVEGISIEPIANA